MSMTKEAAMTLAESRWWDSPNVDNETIVRFQLFEDKLCMDFSQFHRAIESVLGREVFTHEFAFVNETNGLKAEYLGGAEPPTFKEIMNLIPEDKRVLVVLDNEK
jgi:hypothetical protein